MKNERKFLKESTARLEILRTDMGFYQVMVKVPCKGGGEELVKVLSFRDPAFLGRAFQIFDEEMERAVKVPRSCWGADGKLRLGPIEFVSLDGSPTKQSGLWRDYKPEWDEK